MKSKIYETIGKDHVGTGLLLENDGYTSIDMPENKLLKESINDFKSGDLNELPRPFIVSAVFQKYDIKNANGRVYPEAVLKREVNNFQQKIKEHRAFGELEHPNDRINVDLERVCMNITELHWVGHTLVGKFELPITEGFRKYGICSNLADTVAQWLISGLKIGVSSRALGSVEQSGGVLKVGDDLSIECWDVVSCPSTPLAYVDVDEENLKPYIQEDEEKDGTVITEKVDKYSKFAKWLTD